MRRAEAGRLAVSQGRVLARPPPPTPVSLTLSSLAHKQKEAQALRSRLRGSSTECVGVACPGCAQLGPDVPLPPPADQLPDQALSERSQLEGGARRSPLSVETPGTEESPASKQGGAGSGRCSWIWGCRALRLRMGHQLWLLGRPLPGQSFGGKLPRSVPETCSRAPGRQRGRRPWGQDRGPVQPQSGGLGERAAGRRGGRRERANAGHHQDGYTLETPSAPALTSAPFLRGAGTGT